jgi:hypothetical protein
MSNGLTSERLAEQIVVETKQAQPDAMSIHVKLLFGFIAALFVATIALWLKFGEGVFTTSILNAVLACF